MTSRRRFLGSLLAATPLAALAQAANVWSSLPFQWSIPYRYGNARTKVAVFSDPRCPYCRRFEADLARLGDMTVHVFPLAVLGSESIRLSQAAWCAPDRAKAWADLLQRRIEPVEDLCDDPIEALIAYAKKAGIRVTPTWYLESGERYIGAMPIDRLAQVLGRG